MKQLKRSLAIFLTLLMLVSAAPITTFAALTQEQENCTHRWTQTNRGAKYLKDPATCVDGPTYYYQCGNCKANAKDVDPTKTWTDTEGQDPNNHPEDKLQILEQEVPATCTQDGKTAKMHCNACNTDIPSNKLTMHHVEKTPATCTAKAVCDVCGETYGDFAAHTLEKQETAQAATCKDKGKADYWKCSVCEKNFSDAEGKNEIPATSPVPPEIAVDPANHTNLQHKTKVDATCAAKGKEEHWYCDGCQKFFSNAAGTQNVTEASLEIGTKDHEWGEWLYPANFSCAAGGTITRKCKNCPETEEKTLKAGEHNPDEIEDIPEVPATCTEAGKTAGKKCNKCNTYLNTPTDIDPLDHDFKGKATSTDDGKHTIQCTRCDVVSEPEDCADATHDCKCDVCDAQLEHTFSDFVSNENATCVQDGTKTHTCTNCGLKEEVEDEGSHEYGAHDFGEWRDLNDATCLLNGHRERTCNLCHKTETEEIPDSFLNHPFKTDWLYPEDFDCTVGGIRYKECQDCGERIEQELLEPADHIEVEDPAVTRTCTEDGKSEGSHCDRCKKILKKQAIYKAEGHRADENGFKRTKNPTCEVPGADSATCVVCGETFDKAVPALGHDYTNKTVKPSCTASGYTLHTCSRCGKQIKDNIVPPTGHSMKPKTTRATTEKNGKVVLTCKVCGETQSDVVYRIKTVKLSATSFARDGKSHKPSVTVKDSKGNKLKKNTDYTLKFSSGRKAVGTYKVKVTFKGNYKGSKTLKFKIVPPVVKDLKVKKGAGKATLTWTKNKYADTYVIYRATEKDGKYKKLGSTQDLSYTATKLKSGKVYYFKVVAVRKLDSGNYYSADSAIRKATIK